MLHDVFDYSKNDSLCISEALGQPPMVDLELNGLANLSLTSSAAYAPHVTKLPEIPPLVIPSHNQEPAKLNTNPCVETVEQFLNSLKRPNNNLPREELNIFQSFRSIPDCSMDM